jgi:hypothetical protein
MSYTFQGTSFPTHGTMLRAFADAFMHGTPSPTTRDEALSLADEAIAGWGLDITKNGHEDVPSWMDETDTTREDIADALMAYTAGREV